MAKSHAPDGFARFGRYGSNVLVGLGRYRHIDGPLPARSGQLGPGLATRRKRVGDQGDIEALHDIEGRIEDELRPHEKMEKRNEGIRKNSDGIADESIR
jgi:hypothetical protein